MIPIMDGIKEYLGMMHEQPDFVQINIELVIYT